MKALIETLKILIIILLVYCSYLAINTEIEKSQQNITYEIKDKYKEDKLCLIEMLYFEGRGTSKKELEAILDVALNRYRSDIYPDSICGVIKQKMQYSYLNTNRLHKLSVENIKSPIDRNAFHTIAHIVEKRFNGSDILPNIVLPYDSYWYHTKNLKRKPKWSFKLEKIHISEFKHMFYRKGNK